MTKRSIKTMGERIRELREEQDLSLRELARKIGDISAAFLSDVELGRRYPSKEVLGKLATVLGTTSEDLESHDTRPPVRELKRRAGSDPAYGFAFRRVVDSDVTAEDLLKLVEEKEGKQPNQETDEE